MEFRQQYFLFCRFLEKYLLLARKAYMQLIMQGLKSQINSILLLLFRISAIYICYFTYAKWSQIRTLCYFYE